MVSAQGGDVAYIDNVSLFPKSATRIEVKATANGFVKYINAQLIGESAMHLGAGRAKKEDVIDFAAGIVLNKKIGHKVKIGDLLATLYTNKTDYQQVIRDVEDCFVLSNEPVTPNPIVYEVIS
jgi:thymidine phosphorylase